MKKESDVVVEIFRKFLDKQNLGGLVDVIGNFLWNISLHT